MRNRKPVTGVSAAALVGAPDRAPAVEVGVLKLTPLSQVVVGLVLVMSIATLVLAVIMFTQISGHGNGGTASHASAALAMAKEVFRRKKQVLP